MTESDSSRGSFRRSPRSEKSNTGHDEENIKNELTMILQRTQLVSKSSRRDFRDGSISYDAASMAIIRLAALTERKEFGPWLELLTERELTSIKATRNIAAHSGYVAMEDDTFWESITVRVPEILDRLLSR